MPDLLASLHTKLTQVKKLEKGYKEGINKKQCANKGSDGHSLKA